ncbi:MAG: LptF/LptG family permease [Rhizobiales bacterium TMED168]|nr:MAG: LptF/LptG family permease [Rhizobiales bacterium TMED168]
MSYIIRNKMKSIDKYIIRKLSSSFIIVVIGMLSLAWLSQVLKLLDEIVMRGADLSTFFILSVTVLPNIISQITPIAAFITSAFVLNTMSSDKETLILLSSGMNPKRLFKPFLFFGSIVTIFLIIFSMFLGPSGMQYTKLKIHEIRHDLSGTLVRDGMFSMPAKGLTVYAHRKNNNSIDGILVHDNRNSNAPVTYSAEKGYLINENNNPKLILLNGNIQYRNLLIEGPGMTTVSFEKNEYLFSDFITEDRNFNFDSSQRYLNDLLFPSDDDEYAKIRKNVLIAAGNHKIAQIIHPLIFIFFSFVIFIRSKFDRRENNKTLVSLSIGIIIFLAFDFFIASQSQNNNIFIFFLYLLPFSFFLSLIYFFRKKEILESR